MECTSKCGSPGVYMNIIGGINWMETELRKQAVPLSENGLSKYIKFRPGMSECEHTPLSNILSPFPEPLFLAFRKYM